MLKPIFMKKTLKITFPIMLLGLVFITTNCSKKDDFADPKNSSGTEWKSVTTSDGYYYLLNFTGKTTYELSDFDPNYISGKPDLIERGSYSIDENNIEFEPDGYSDYPDRGVIEGGKLTYYDLFGEDEYC